MALSIATAAAEPTPLTVEENEKLLASLVEYYQARASMLEALADSTAGNSHMKRVDAATKQVQGLMDQLQKAHGADATCSWDYGTKSWACK
jgi:poly-gamma-glutamate capsule biosynthesis protein CapA/YwtB (metallophosphatase superfamily)